MELPQTADLAVVGCGIFGLSTAAFAAMSGKKVVAFDRSHIGAGSSGRSGAIIRAYYYNQILAQGAVRCRKEIWENFNETFKRKENEPPVYRKTGSLIFTSTSEEGTDNFKKWQLGIESINEKTVKAAFPFLRPPTPEETVWWEPNAGCVHTTHALHSLKKCIEQHQGTVAEFCQVIEFHKETGGTWSVVTSKGRTSVGALVLSPGPWMPALGHKVDLDLPIEAHRIQITLLNRAATYPGDLPVILDIPSDFYSRSMDGGVSHVGFLSHTDHQRLENMERFDESIRSDLSLLLRRQFEFRVPQTKNSFFHGHRAAAYSMTPDGNFILGQTPHPNLYIAAGGSGHGYKFGPLIGRELNYLIDGIEAPFVGASMFSFKRDYKSGHGMLGK